MSRGLVITWFLLGIAFFVAGQFGFKASTTTLAMLGCFALSRLWMLGDAK